MTRIRNVSLALALTLAALAPVASGAVSSDEGFHLVRFPARITDADRAALDATGARVIDYEPHDSYIVWADDEQVRAARAFARVEPLPLARKRHPALRDGFVDVTVYGPAFDTARQALGALAPIERAHVARPDGLLATLSVALPRAAVDALVREPWVLYVNPSSRFAVLEDEATDQIQAGMVDPATRRPVPGYEAWLASHGLDGDGVVVTVVDGGISKVHPDLQGRIVATVDYTGRNQPDISGHGTHVAGIVGGDPPVDLVGADLFVFGIGVAPKVKLVDQNAIAFGAPFPPPDGMQVLSRDAWRAGARIWNASWTTGEGPKVGYVANARLLDQMARDADFETAGREELLLVFSAGNSGGSGITSPKEAKNIIAVGSTNSGRNLVGLQRTHGDSVSSFSSRGPALDGRIMPLISAPGGDVVSAYQPGTTTAAGACLPPPGGAPFYATCSGTSMAAPHVAGAAALIHQWWLRETGTLPSPTLVKAILVNGAEDIARADVPNRHEGWGRVNLSNVFAPIPFIAEDQATVFDGPGEASERVVTVADPSKPLRVTLAWSDAPGAEGANPALVNDLDLVVERLDANGVPVRAWLGNVFMDGASVEGGEADRLNNVENVFLPVPEPGTYRVSVRAHNVPGDGVPHDARSTDQDFALFIRNAV